MPQESTNLYNDYNPSPPEPIQNPPQTVMQEQVSQSYVQPTNTVPPVNTAPLPVKRAEFVENSLIIFRRYPGKTGYIGALTGSIIFAFLPWIGTIFTLNSYNYFYLIGRNPLSLLYILSIFALIFMRLADWFQWKFATPYSKIFDYLEVLLIGGVVMYSFSIGSFGDIQFGLMLTVITNLLALSYVTYIKLIKSK